PLRSLLNQKQVFVTSVRPGQLPSVLLMSELGAVNRTCPR
ncbi:RCC1 domain containing 1, isoform CRA_b, partial [Mus musculus]